MKRYWAITVLLVVLFSASTKAADKTQGVGTIGTGTFSCEKFSKYDAAPNSARQMDLPGRELVTASLFVLVIMTFVVWGGWKLTSLILTSLI